MNNELLAAGYEESGDRATNGLRQEADGVPNKPMVLTALTTTEEPAISSVRQHIGEPLGAERRATNHEQRAAGGNRRGNEERRGGLAVTVFDSSWRTFAVRTVVLGAVVSAGVFVAMRAAGAREGEPGGHTRTTLTVAGTLTPVAGPHPTTFTFRNTTSGMNCTPPAVLVTPAPPSGAFSAEVDIASCPTTLFDGANVTVVAVVRDLADAAVLTTPMATINPVPYARYADHYGTPDCPVGYERDTINAPAHVVLCRKLIQEGLADYVVRVGSGATAFWIDRFEASVWARAPGTRGTLSHHDSHTSGSLPPSFSPNGQWRSTAITAPFVFAFSATGVTPASNITWFQANEACAASGKRLLTGEEWLRAAQETPDSGRVSGASATEVRCNTAPPDIHQAHRLDGDPSRTDACVSVWGATDMIGNLSEWTAEWYASVGQVTSAGTVDTEMVIGRRVLGGGRDAWPAGYGSDGTWNVASVVTTRDPVVGATDNVIGMPSAAIRGSDWGGGVRAGIFSLNLSAGPSHQDSALGFRCVIPR